SGPAGIAIIPQSALRSPGKLAITTTVAPQVLLVDPATGQAQVVAGDGNASTEAAFDNVPGARARFVLPAAVVADSVGRLYVADSGANVIRRVDVDSANTVTTIAGTLGMPGDADGNGAAARFTAPTGVALQGDSILYVTDTGNHRVRRVDLASSAVSTIAGSVA